MKRVFLFSVVCTIAIFVTSCKPAQTPGQTIQPQDSVASTETPMPKPEPIRVEFQASDGHALVGYFYPSPLPHAPVVVLMHMWRATQQEWVRLGLVEWLQNWTWTSAGTPVPTPTNIYPVMPEEIAFNVFTFDYRGHGESGPAIDFYSQDPEQIEQMQAGWLLDAEAAYETARTLPGVDPTHIAGIGASLGGAGVVYSCSKTCIGALSLSPGELPNQPYKEAVKVMDDAGKPVWCLAQEKDQFRSAEICQSASGKHYNSIIYEGEGEFGLHGMALLLPGSAPPNIGQHILDFLLLVFEKDQ